MRLSALLSDVARTAPELAPRLAPAHGAQADVADPELTAVVQNHAEVVPGALFVARRGERHDAHDHIAEAVARGAVAVVGERAPSDPAVVAQLAAAREASTAASRGPLAAPVPYAHVPDSRRSLPHLAAAFYGHPSESLRVFGVTGTDGKTTTSYLLQRILSASFVTGLVSTAGSGVAGPGAVSADARQFALAGHFTTPEATDVQRLLAAFAGAGASHAVLESSSHGFSLHRLDAVAYDVGIVTNLSPEHLDHHKTLAGYLSAKATLVERASFNLVNLDDEHHAAFVAAADAAGNEVLGYGQAEGADVRLGEVESVPGGLRFTVAIGASEAEVRLPLIGHYNAWNAAAALGAAVHAGVPLSDAAASLEDFSGVPGRMQVLSAEPFTVVVDFAHTAPALAKALAAVRPEAGRVIVVVGAAGERDPGKRAPLGSAAIRGADLTLFTEEDSRSEPFAAIAQGLEAGATQAGGRPGHDYRVVPDRSEAIAAALAAARPGDVVLLAGKGHERTLERAEETIAWDEAALARRLLAG